MAEPNKHNRNLISWALGIIVFVLMTMLILLQASNLWKTFSVDTANDALAFYALSSLNFVAFIIFAFIFTRNIIKLSRERRTFQLGSKIKTRLLIYFAAVSLLPIIAMAVFSFWFLNRALDRWFTQIPENAVKEARQTQERAVEDQINKLRENAQALVSALKNDEITPAKLYEIGKSGNLKLIGVLDGNGKFLAQSNQNNSEKDAAHINQTINQIRQNNFEKPYIAEEEGFDGAAAAFPDGRILIIIPNVQIRENVSPLVKNSLSELDKLKERQATVRQIAFSTLALLTFLLIFASSWTAFYIARGITVPIKALAEGADQLAHGNYNHRVNVLAEDELALLVAAFNQMSSRLEENSAQLDERRRYIETILQSLPTGVISLNDENRVTTINNTAVEMLKLEAGDFKNFPLANLVGNDNYTALEKLIARAKRTGKAGEQTSLRRENLDGNTLKNEDSMPVALTATALPDKNGAVLVIEDLTDLLQAQRASAWSEVARRMAHEIKNPLTPIQLSAERIAKKIKSAVRSPQSAVESGELSDTSFYKQTVENRLRTADSKAITEGTETILREVASLKAMVDEFSRFARLPNVKLETGSLNEIISKSAVLFEDREVKIVCDLAENLPQAMIDEEQLKRVFVNLIENAVEAFDSEQENKQIHIKTFHDTGRDLIVAEISDNGNGIPPSDFQKLFQPYFSTKGRGTGLGLAIVQRIIIEHGGKIKAVNNSPKGARFIVELPMIG